MSWTTKLMEALGLTRDSLSLFWAKWVALILALAPMGVDVTKLGIPAHWVPYIQLVALFVSVSSAQHRTSDLPGEPVAPPMSKASIGKFGGTAALILASTVIWGACAPVTVQSPPARAAYGADQVVQRIGEFQQTVIDLSDAKRVQVADARAIVQWCLDATQTLRTVPSGWQPTVQTGWALVRPKVAAVPALQPWLAVIDSLVSSANGGA